MQNLKWHLALKREIRPTLAAERLLNCLLAGDSSEDNIDRKCVQLLTEGYAVSVVESI